MDWNLAIRRNREALERILAALFALVGLEDGIADGASFTSPLWRGRRSKFEHCENDADPGGGDALPITPTRRSDDRRPPHKGEVKLPVTLPRHLHAHVRRILRAAEAAIRRLIVIAAREVAVTVSPGGETSRPDLAFLRKGIRKEPAGTDAPVRIPAFPLLDPLKRFPLDPPRRASKSFPRISVVGFIEPTPIPEKPVLSPDDPVDAASLCRRLLSSKRALANLPREARRLARWKARDKIKLGPRRVVPPLRIGRPPGGRKHPTHAVDDILKECQALALDVLDPPDTS